MSMQHWRAHIARFGYAHLPGEIWARITFLVLLAVAAILRFWDLPQIPYTHDEISALVRIYPSLYETLRMGYQVHVDAHPPGVQIFEWIWTKLFGMSESMVKLPFIVMGLAAIFLLYRTAILWTGAGVALLLTALMATLQYSVMYAQIARPYAVGLFTTALLADQLTRYVALRKWKYLRAILIAAVLSAYTHHFSMMLAALMVITGFFLIQPEQRKPYLFMCLFGILLYLPNIPLFLQQLSIGGLTGWLSPPDEYWLGDYLMFIAHWSIPFVVVLTALVMLSFILWNRFGVINGPCIWIFLLWGIIPMVVGLLYSVLVAPVVQYSMLLFSFPYLVIALLMGASRLPRTATIVLVLIVSSISILTLVNTRKHYEVFYSSKYEEMILTGLSELREYGHENVEVLLDAPDEVIRFYLKLWSIPSHEFPYVQLRGTMSVGHLDRRLTTLTGRRIVYGQANGAPREQLARIQSHFPYLLHREDLADGQVFILSDKGNADPQIDRELIGYATPNELSGNWEIDPHLGLAKDGGNVPAWDFEGREFGVAISLLTDTILADERGQFEVIAYLRSNSTGRDASLAGQLFVGDSSVFYRDARLSELIPTEGPQHLIVAVSPSDAHLRNTPINLKAYVYNHGLGPLAVERVEVWTRRGDPWQYGLIQPLR